MSFRSRCSSQLLIDEMKDSAAQLNSIKMKGKREVISGHRPSKNDILRMSLKGGENFMANRKRKIFREIVQ